ncbi:RNA polymerase II C-terminal domain phosphatase-like 4 [Aristolochia californica]|uniref:RNA polymerase II C-terminal domain phosphatase-like 4 n=1 Tax=Aristolochia californica TaxID=171875 RepID=UPI0035DF1C4F
MNLAADSPLSSSSDDFAAILDAELASTSSEESPDLAEDIFDAAAAAAADDLEQDRFKRRRVGEPEAIVESKQSLPETKEKDALKASVSNKMCPHPGMFGGMCMACGQVIDDDSGIAFGYIHKHLRLGSEEIARLRVKDSKILLRERKLRLILDLDHTLLNSTRLIDVSSREEYLKQGDLSVGLHKLERMHMLTKLRPFVHTFLKEASELFEMYVYTMAENSYALEIAKLLDPERVYFGGSRVISQADCTQKHQKGLDVVLGAENAMVILDDTEMVWQKHKENLIPMDRYHYFASSFHQFGLIGPSLSELKQDESESDGALATVLKVLKKVHQMFFDSEQSTDIASRDVRLVLKAIRGEILKGCKLVFSHVFPTEFPAETHPLWKMAEQMGAVCSAEVDSSVTHVVSLHPGTEKARWAMQEGKFLVHRRWVEAASFLWKRQPEEQYVVTHPSKNQ